MPLGAPRIFPTSCRRSCALPRTVTDTAAAPVQPSHSRSLPGHGTAVGARALVGADRRSRWSRIETSRFPHHRALEIRAALDTLEPDDAELIRLIHWDGFSVWESAELLGLNESTAGSRHARAKDALRRALEPERP
jgi:DNA-directed RNA polymerase specialized sigma24 family protein